MLTVRELSQEKAQKYANPLADDELGME